VAAAQDGLTFSDTAPENSGNAGPPFAQDRKIPAWRFIMATRSSPRKRPGRSKSTTPATQPARRGHVLWKGAIAFGLVHVPVELHAAATQSSLDLNLLDRRSFQPIGYKKINKITGKEVSNENIVKGYEYEKGEYVVLGDEDFRQANPKATQTVEILSFIGADEIPTPYYDTPYYLVPTAQGKKVYALLRDTMLKTGYVALATVIIQTKQHLAAVIADEDKLTLNTLRYGDEVRDASGFEFPGKEASLKPAEIKMAEQLIESMRGEWRPEDYRDTYREDVMARIQAKIKAGETHVVPTAGEAERPRSAEVIDLMSLLKKSIPATGGDAKKRAPAASGKTTARSKSTSAPRKRA
jgi:DNA end-binding protein Ku